MPLPAPSKGRMPDDPIAALRCLLEPLAQILVLADVHEFSPKEIQETLGIPVDNLKSLLTRGRDTLAAFISNGAAAGPAQASTASATWREGLEESRRLQPAQ